jgi:hypothetical protein
MRPALEKQPDIPVAIHEREKLQKTGAAESWRATKNNNFRLSMVAFRRTRESTNNMGF